MIDTGTPVTLGAYGINSSGHFVGTYIDAKGIRNGFLIAWGILTSLVPPSALDTQARGINDSDEIVGFYTDAIGTHGFLDAEGKYTAIDFPGASSTQAYGINSAGQIVGEYKDAHGIFHGFIATPDISVTPTTYDFGNVKVERSKTVSFTIKNRGTISYTISTFITGEDASMFTTTGGSRSKTIKPTQILTIRVTFKPTSTGPKTSTMEVIFNGLNATSIDIPLKGTGQ